MPSILTLLRNAEYCSFIKTQSPHHFCLCPGKNFLDIILSSPFIKPRKTPVVNCCENGSANE
ncbi:hypothetical protein DP190_05570 [Enterobacter cloacae]|nr:hypothetical protein DP190_05570 [Enterobacter cloacae]